MAGADEKVVIRAGDCQVTLLPGLGGKIASLKVNLRDNLRDNLGDNLMGNSGDDLRDNLGDNLMGNSGDDQMDDQGVEDCELLQAPLRPYGERTRTMGFEESDASGWDECLPTVAGCRVETAGGGVDVPDHGDLWRVPWRVAERTEDSATLMAECFSLPLGLTRTMLLGETATGWRLFILYSLTNSGNRSVPWSWAAHPLFVCEEGDRIRLPETVKRVSVENSKGQRLGVSGAWIEWPVAKLSNPERRGASPEGSHATSYDLSYAMAGGSGAAEKLFTERLEEDSGWCALERVRLGLRLTVRFDARITPYLGLWLCDGGWPATGERRQTCVALEPTTAPTDSLAVDGPWSRMVDPGVTVHWPMELCVDRMDQGDSYSFPRGLKPD